MRGSDLGSALGPPAPERIGKVLGAHNGDDADPVALFDALVAAGALRLLQPQRWGGSETTLVEFSRTVRAVAERCTSAAWLTAHLGASAWLASLFTDAAQAEIWTAEPGSRVAVVRAPLGRLRRTAGGEHLLSGTWRRGSGVAAADWIIVAAAEVDPQGRAIDLFWVLLPRTSVVLREAEPEVGLRGVAAHAVRAEEIAVPLHRLLRAHDVAQRCAPGTGTNRGALYRLPWSAIQGEAAAAPLLGTAGGLASATGAAVRRQLDVSLGGGEDADGRLRVALARAHAEVDASILQTERNLVDLHAAGSDDEADLQELVARVRRDQACAAERAVAAVDGLFAVRARLPADLRSRVETAWCDVHTAEQHFANDVSRVLRAYGGVVVGRVNEPELA